MSYEKGGTAVEVNRVVCGDCVEIMSTLPNNCIDATITSPPY
jgi:DNA modification methylase